MDSARELLAEHGLEALTMRALADRLGVAPNALYSHVASKDDLLDEVLDHVLAAVEVGPVGRSPADVLSSIMRSSYAVLLQHSTIIPLYFARQGAHGPNAQQLGAVMDEQLRRLGLRTDDVVAARRALIVHVIGSAAFDVAAERAAAGSRGQRHESPFEKSLQWLLAGIVSTTR